MALNGVLAVVLLAAAGWTGSASVRAAGVQAIAALACQALVLRALAGPSTTRHASLRFWASAGLAVIYSLAAGVVLGQALTRGFAASTAAPWPALVMPGVAFAALVLLRLAVAGSPASPAASNPDDEHAAATLRVTTDGGIATVGAALAALGLATGAGLAAADPVVAVTIGLGLGFVAARTTLALRDLVTAAAGTPPPARERRPPEPAAPIQDSGTSAIPATGAIMLEPTGTTDTKASPPASRTDPPRKNHPPQTKGRHGKKRNR